MDEETLRAIEDERAFGSAVKTLAAMPYISGRKSLLDMARNTLRAAAILYLCLEEEDLRPLLGGEGQ